MKTVVVTGSARGFGYEFVRLFRERDYNVVVCDISKEALKDAEKKLLEISSRGKVLTYEVDITNEDMVSNMITNVLKEEMGFKGLIITDSLTMSAIYNRYSIREIVKYSVNAGNDIIMFCGEANMYDQETIISEFIDLVKTGEIPMSRIEESVKKIISLKEKYKITLGNSRLDDNDIKNKFNIENELSKQLTNRSISLFKDENQLLPIKEGEKVLSIFPKFGIATLVDNADNEQISIGKYYKCDEIIY